MSRQKAAPALPPEGFPTVGSVVRYYWEGWRMGTLISATDKVAVVTRPHKRNLTIVIEDVEIPKKENDGILLGKA